MKKFFLFTAIILTSFNLFAQEFSLSGKITDKNKNPLSGASIILNGTFAGTISKSDGTFKFEKLKQGKYNLKISFIGYKTINKTINLNKDLFLSYDLQKTNLISDEIIISAALSKQNTPVAQTTIKKTYIKNNNIIADIPFMLEKTPSLVAISETGTGVGYSNMRIRGTDMSRINVTINGIPLNDAESQGVYFVDLPDLSSSVNSIQIQRGVGTSKNGAAAFGASINFQTITLNKKPYANIGVAAGSFNTFKENISAGTGLINKKFAFDVRYSKLNAKSYIQRGFSDHESIFLSGTYYGKNDLLKAIVLIGKERTGITWWGVPDYMIDSIRNFNPAGRYIDDNGNEQFYDNQTDNYWQNHYQLLYTREINSNLNINAALHATTGKGYYEQYIPETDDWDGKNKFSDYGLQPIYLNDTILTTGNYNYIFPDSTISASDMIRQKWLDNIFYGMVFSANYHKNKIDATFGASANKYDGNHFGYVKWSKFNTSIPNNYKWYQNKGIKTEKNIFFKLQYYLTKKISTFGDIQARFINYDMSGPDDDLVSLDQKHNWTFINPKFGINYDLNSANRAYLSFAVANREPARGDIKEATKKGGTKMPTFETLYDYEAGYQLKQKKYALGINLYYMMYNNQLINTGEVNNVGYKIKTNVKDSYRRGIELIFDTKIINKIYWSANVTLSQNKILNFVEYADHYDSLWNKTYEATNIGETNISFSPEIIASNTLTYNIYKDFNISLQSKYVGKQYFDNTSSEDRKIDPYFINNIKLSYNLMFKNRTSANIIFLFNNIFNIDYIANAYGGVWYEQGTEKTWAYYFPQAGRTFTVKLNINF